MKRMAFFAAIAALMTACSSCWKAETKEPEVPEDMIPENGNNDGNPEDNPRKELSLTTRSQELVRQSSTFAFNFLSRVNAFAEGDFILSPLSMQFLLGMLLNGAQGPTANEICQVLGYGAGEVEAVNEFALSMMEQLPSLDQSTALRIANSIWVNEATPLRDGYRKTVSDSFDAEVANRDMKDPATLLAINQWASDHTNGLIPKVLDELDPRTAAILMNALYFKSQWTHPFDKERTAKQTFYKENGKTEEIDMMRISARFVMDQKSESFRAIRLPYGNEAFSMLVFLPVEGKTLADVIGELSRRDWTSYLQSLTSSCQVNLWLPKFRTKSHFTLNGILSDMGMPLAFSDFADFTALSDKALSLSAILQDAVIIVDEEGTEAAAVSTGIAVTTALPPDPIVFRADHPFLYLITEASTGAILFAGSFRGTAIDQ